MSDSLKKEYRVDLCKNCSKGTYHIGDVCVNCKRVKERKTENNLKSCLPIFVD